MGELAAPQDSPEIPVYIRTALANMMKATNVPAAESKATIVPAAESTALQVATA